MTFGEMAKGVVSCWSHVGYFALVKNGRITSQGKKYEIEAGLWLWRTTDPLKPRRSRTTYLGTIDI